MCFFHQHQAFHKAGTGLSLINEPKIEQSKKYFYLLEHIRILFLRILNSTESTVYSRRGGIIKRVS